MQVRGWVREGGGLPCHVCELPVAFLAHREAEPNERQKLCTRAWRYTWLCGWRREEEEWKRRRGNAGKRCSIRWYWWREERSRAGRAQCGQAVLFRWCFVKRSEESGMERRWPVFLGVLCPGRLPWNGANGT